MAITIAKALKLKEMECCKLVAGVSGVNQTIQYVDSMEVPDISPWLKKRELMITTGYSIKNNPKALIMLIENLHKVEAAGIVIKTARFIGEIPQEALKRADDLGVPVIEAPNDVSIAELSNSIIKAIVNEQTDRLEFSEKIHEKFTELELSGGGFDEITEMLFRFLEMPIVIADHDFRMIAIRSNQNIKTQEYLRNLFPKSKMKDFLNSDLSEITMQDEENHINVLVRKARAKQNICGYIFVLYRENDFDEMNRIILDHAITTVALEFTKLESMAQHQRLMDDNFLVDIVMKNIKSEEEAEYRARYLEWPKPPLVLTLFDIDSFEECIQNRTELEVLELKKEITLYISDSMENAGIICKVISKSDRFFCICSNKYLPLLEDVLKGTVKRLKKQLGLSVTVGYTKEIDTYTGLWEGHNDATDAIKICRKSTDYRQVACIEDFRLEQALMHSIDNPYFKRYVKETIHKLEQYDKENNTDLLSILRELVRNMGVRTKTAEALFLHRNTLLYRIRKIESLTGYDLSRDENLLKLGFAMMIHPYF